MYRNEDQMECWSRSGAITTLFEMQMVMLNGHLPVVRIHPPLRHFACREAADFAQRKERTHNCQKPPPVAFNDESREM